MGQFALGLRSLLIKGTIFVIMAALLAWALGGTLFPRPARAVVGGSTSFAGRDWFWRVSVVEPTAGIHSEGSVQWQLMHRQPGGDPRALDDLVWREVAGPVVSDGHLYFAGRLEDAESDQRRWELVSIDSSGTLILREAMPDRLAIEQQLERLRSGLPLQRAEMICAQRPQVLDPQPDSAEEQSQTNTN
jgi:hypothetical protein